MSGCAESQPVEENSGRGTSVMISGEVKVLGVGAMEESKVLGVGAMEESNGGETGELMSGCAESQAMEDNPYEKDGTAQSIWVDSQEDEYDDLDELKLDMLHHMMPGFTQCFKRK